MPVELGINIEAVTDEQIVPHLSRFNFLTAKRRMLPDVFVIGVQKGGTSSLTQYLQAHPQILPPQRKDVYYFNNENRYRRGLNYYRAFFPLNYQKRKNDRRTNAPSITFDGTPNYFDVPEAAHRLKNDFPNAKLVLLLRDPVARAYSNYNMALKFGFETLSFEEALHLENERIAWFEKSPFFKGHNFVYQRMAYRRRGEYADFLPLWKNLFQQNLLVLFTHDLENKPQETYNKILEFIGLPPFTIDFVKHNKGEYAAKIDENTLHGLHEHYLPWNDKLKQQLNCELPW